MINNGIRKKIKIMLSKLIPDSSRIRYLSYLPRLETWRRSHRERYPLFRNRYELYSYISSEILHDEPITYLEFGVAKGDSIRHWSSINKHSDSMFFGFDTFSGLPTSWDTFTRIAAKGTFDMKGEVPDIKDSRVSFLKGLFQNVIPNFLKEQKISSKLVIHMDADLYSSTLYVLTRCNDIIFAGTIVIFDEFAMPLDEFRALEDYSYSYMRNYVVLGATEKFEQIAIQME